jgi:hypothetical protein
MANVLFEVEVNAASLAIFSKLVMIAIENEEKYCDYGASFSKNICGNYVLESEYSLFSYYCLWESDIVKVSFFDYDIEQEQIFDNYQDACAGYNHYKQNEMKNFDDIVAARNICGLLK